MFWAPNESVSAVVECPLPSQVRCLGWNATLFTMQCGAGYDKTSAGCSACEKHYYPELQLCQPCPRTGLQIAYHVIAVIAAAALVLGGGLAVVAYVVLKRGAKLRVALLDALDFLIWMLFTWQTVVQVGMRTSGGPAALAMFYSWMSLVQLNFSVIAHPACYSSDPFSLQKQMLGGSLTLCCGTACLFAFGAVNKLRLMLPSALQPLLARLQRWALLLMTLYYPLVSNIALASVYCIKVHGSWVLAANSNYQCLGGDHAPVAGLAVLVLLLHIVAFPCATLMYLVRWKDKVSDAPPAWRTTWQNIVFTDFQPQYFWLAHLNTLALFALSCMVVFGSRASTAGEVMMFVCTVAISAGPVLLMRAWHVLLPDRQWKWYIIALSSATTAVGALVNLVWYFVGKSGSVSLRHAGDVLSYIQLVVCLALGGSFLFAYCEVLGATNTGAIRARKLVRYESTAVALYGDLQTALLGEE